MNKLWILVCDSSRGRLFETYGNHSPWNLLQVLSHEESREKAKDLVSDHSGRNTSQGASVHHNALAATPPKQVEKGRFAHTLATMLDQAMRSKRFDRLALVAPPEMLGMLKKELTKELQAHLMTSVDKDLTHMQTDDLVHRLREATTIPLNELELEIPREPIKHAH